MNLIIYINFIINISNDIIKATFKKEKDLCFKHIDYKFKKNIKFENFEKLNNSEVKDIIQMRITSKYRSKTSENENFNKEIYQKVITQDCKFFSYELFRFL